MSYKCLFFNDYSEGAHPRVLEALSCSNLSQETGYGEDSFTHEAAAHLRRHLKAPAAQVHFVSAGTQANLIALAAMMRPVECVIGAHSAHINVHEAGAVEATGHKILAIPSKDGKITSEGIQELLADHGDEHKVKPKVVFLSHATELGTIYSKAELTQISNLCKANNLYLYLDGARLGTALTATGADLPIAEIARLVDAFYIGGTKNGALLGEAIVIVHPELQRDFRFYLKQHGALLAKGRVLGLQFTELFKDELYFELATHANDMARRLAQGIQSAGYTFLTEPMTNLIFPVLPHRVIERLKTSYGFYVWSKIDAEYSALRLVTSWATTAEMVDMFVGELHALAVNQ